MERDMTTTGRIRISKVNLMGYTPETQAFIIQNDGGMGSVATAKFLQKISKFMSHTSFGYVIDAPRLAKFKAYVASQGFETVEA